LKYKKVVLNYNNVLLYFNQINASMVSVRDFFQKHLQNLTDHVYVYNTMKLRNALSILKLVEKRSALL